jgi:radical SAM domain protein
MKNYFSRMNIVLTNKCNQKCPWCFEGNWKQGNAREMSLDNIKKLLVWNTWDDGIFPVVYLLGGEPTLHPKLIDIIDIITNHNIKISKFLLTNMTCDRDLLVQLIKRKVVIFANVDQFELDNNVANQQVILDNLKYLNEMTPNGYQYNISATVSHPEKDFSFLYDILKNGRNKIYNLRLAQSCVGFEYSNPFQKEKDDSYFETTLKVLKECRRIKPSLHLSAECSVNNCMISEEIYDELNQMGYGLRRSTCGLPEPNADIMPDMSCHWCFAFENIPEMKIKNVFDYSNYRSMLNEMQNKYYKFIKKYNSFCVQGKCSYESCRPCAALNYYSHIRNAK